MRAGILEARKQNKPVEVVNAFTETSRTWAFPDGSLKTESYTGPTQVKQDDGSWALIDTTLVEKDGVLKPKVGGAADIAFSLGGGDAPFAVMKRDEGQRFSLSWDKALPRPVVKGNVATYPDAAGPAADLVVTALPTGFQHDVVLRERPKGPLEIRMPVESSELTFAKSKQGGLQLTDGKDKVVAQAPQPVMWDSTGGQDPKAAAVPRRAPISTSVVGDGDKQVLVLKPDTAWLADPATTFPVVVDPTSTLTVKTDTLLSSGADCNVNDQPGATLLKIGAAYYGCNGVDAVNYWRSYLLFDVSSLANKPIISSTMQLWRTQSPDCHLRGNGKIYAGRLNGSWTPRKMTWANKPSTTDFVATPCPTTNVLTPGVMTWPITNWVKDWATGQPNYGIDLEGPTESVDRYSSYSAVFHSAEMTGTGATPPKLITQYILPPEIPTVTVESVDSMDGDHAIVRKSSAKVGYRSTSVDGRNIDYYASVIDSTAPLPAWTTGGGEVGKWNFTDGTGGSDSSGQGNILTFMDGRYSWIDGKDGKALLLNGTVNAPSSASTNKPVMRTDKSFSAAGWVRLDVGTKTIPLISQSGTVNSAFSVGYDSTSRKWNMQMYHANSGTNLTEIKSSSVAQIGTWTHLVGVYDAVAKKMRLYVNGVLASEADYTATPWNADQMFELGNGRYSGFGYSSVKAAYDEIRAYNRVLSPTEIQWMLALSPPTNANLPSGQAASITYDVGNVDSFKISIRACINGATPITCSESPYYRITTDAPYLPTDTETGMADPTRPILSGMVSRPSGGLVTAKYFLYSDDGLPVGSSPLGAVSVSGGERASFEVPENVLQGGHAYKWQMQACVVGNDKSPDSDSNSTPMSTPNSTVTPTGKSAVNSIVEQSDGVEEVCTSKTAPLNFTAETVGGETSETTENVRRLTLRQDNFYLKTGKMGATACDGEPCTLADANKVILGGTGEDKIVTVMAINVGEIPGGSVFTEAVIDLGSAICSPNPCPPDTAVSIRPLNSEVVSDTKGSDLAAMIDADTNYSVSVDNPKVNVAGYELSWFVLESSQAIPISFGSDGVATPISMITAYIPPGPPSRILNLLTQPGNKAAIASWGLPESNGSMSILDGYDIEVIDANGGLVHTMAVTESQAAIEDLNNGEIYTIKVRSRTRFGVSDWESATVTPKAPPPPPPPSPSQSCLLDELARSAITQADETTQAYVGVVKSYYEAQDAVLEGRAQNVWQVPGISADGPVTAELSLANGILIAEKEAMDAANTRQIDSTVDLSDVVAYEVPGGNIHVRATVTRTWNLVRPGPENTQAAKAQSISGQVEPQKSKTSMVTAFNRCGDFITFYEPDDLYEDSSDFIQGSAYAELVNLMGVPGEIPGEMPGSRMQAPNTAAVPPRSRFEIITQPRPAEIRPVKGAAVQVVGRTLWRSVGNNGETWRIDTFGSIVRFYHSPEFFSPKAKIIGGGWIVDKVAKERNEYIYKNSSLNLSSKGCFKGTVTTIQGTVSGSATIEVGVSPSMSYTVGGELSFGRQASADCQWQYSLEGKTGKPFQTAMWDSTGYIAECHQSMGNLCSIDAHKNVVTGTFKMRTFRTSQEDSQCRSKCYYDASRNVSADTYWIRPTGLRYGNEPPR